MPDLPRPEGEKAKGAPYTTHESMGKSLASQKRVLGRVIGVEKRVGVTEKKITILKNILKMRQQSENIGSTLSGIQDSVDSIAETVGLQYDEDLQQKETDRINAEQDEGKKREGALEKVSSGVVKGAQKALAPVTSLMDKIGKFLLTVLMGTAVVKFLDWFNNKKNTGKAENLMRFVKDFWPVIVAGLMAFLPALLGPAGMLIGTIALLAWGIPKLIAAVKSIFGMNKDVDKVIGKNEQDLSKDVKGTDAIGKEFKKQEDEMKKINTKGDPNTSVDPNQNSQELSGVEQGTQKFNEGGMVQGPGGVDKVPARLSAGEFVMSKGAVQKYGADTMASMNSAGGGSNQPVGGAYNGGGLVDLSNKHSSIDNRSHTTSIGGVNVSRNVDVKPTQRILPYEGKEYHKKYQFGGKVTGRGGNDNVPAKLTAGEYVMSRSAVNTFGANTFASMNASGGGTNRPVEKHFSGGGLVTPTKNITTPEPPTTKKGKIKVIQIPTPPSSSSGGSSGSTGNKIPRFSAIVGGGIAKEQTLGIRR